MTTQTTPYTESNVPTSRRTATDGRSTTEPVEVTTPEMIEKFKHMMESSKHKVTEWKGGLQDGIRAKPIQSVLIAAAVGATIGLIIGRRSR